MLFHNMYASISNKIQTEIIYHISRIQYGESYALEH